MDAIDEGRCGSCGAALPFESEIVVIAVQRYQREASGALRLLSETPIQGLCQDCGDLFVELLLRERLGVLPQN